MRPEGNQRTVERRPAAGRTVRTAARHWGRVAVIAVALAAVGSGAPAGGQETAPVGPRLTPKLRQLLRQEMQAILLAMHEILDASVRGDDATVADRAQRIHDSFILDQSLTEQDREDLMAAVPPGFVQLDRSFHELAARLAAAAREGDRAGQAEILGEMVGACAACHGAFATDVFPMFVGGGPAGDGGRAE